MLAQIFYPKTRIYRQIQYKIRQRQQGLCYGCRRLFSGIDPIVRGSSKKPRYYHYDCAERFKIIDISQLASISKIVTGGSRAIGNSVRHSVRHEYLKTKGFLIGDS